LAEKVEARNPLEQTLCHQLTVAHTLALRLAEKAGAQLDLVTNRSAPVVRQEAMAEAIRLTAVVARMMETFQRGVLALERLQKGGQQVVVVQHVNVSGDAKAVVAGSVEGGLPGGAKRET
jgi:hypothetical protein